MMMMMMTLKTIFLICSSLVGIITFGDASNDQTQTQPKQTQLCYPLLPGLERMSRGVDITMLDLFPSDLSLTNGFRQSLFDFTCNVQNRFWSHPSVSTTGATTGKYVIPDQVAAINSVPGGVLNSKTTFHQQLSDYKKQLAVQVGLDVNTGVYGDYSLSVGYRSAQEKILATNQTIVEVSSFVSAFQMDFKPFSGVKGNGNFQKYLNELAQSGATYKDAPERYSRLLETYGTHYFESGIFGGYLLQQSVIDDVYRYRTTDHDINVEVGAKYAEMVGGKIPIQPDTKKQTESSFDQYSNTAHYYYGGSTNLLQKLTTETFDQWTKSVITDPWLFGGRLVSIEQLIKNVTIAKQTSIAINVKLTKAYLQELRRSVELIEEQQLLKRAPSSSSNKELIAMINTESAKVIPNEETVKGLATQVEKLIHDAQVAKDRDYLTQYLSELNKLQQNELYCKNQVTTRCEHDKRQEIIDTIEQVRQLQRTMREMIKDQTNEPNTILVRRLINTADTLVSEQRTQPLGKCKEKLFCNLCKDVVVDIIKKVPCNTEHIKKLLNVQI